MFINFKLLVFSFSFSEIIGKKLINYCTRACNLIFEQLYYYNLYLLWKGFLKEMFFLIFGYENLLQFIAGGGVERTPRLDSNQIAFIRLNVSIEPYSPCLKTLVDISFKH